VEYDPVLSEAEPGTDRLYFSELLGRAVLGQAGERIGTVADGIVRLVESRPRLTGILLRLEGSDVFLPVDNVADLWQDELRLSGPSPDMRPFERRQGEVLLDRDVVGRGVIDVEGARLVQVDDLVLERRARTWYVVAVVAEPIQTFGRLLRRVLGQKGPRGEEIPWSRVEPLVGHVPTAGLRPRFVRLSGLRPADIADIVEEASREEGEQILNAVHSDPELEADVFEELSEDKQVEFLKRRSDQEAATILANMEPDRAADILLDLDQERRKPILEALPADERKKVRELLSYGEETAGGLMNNEFVALPKTETVQRALQLVRDQAEQPQVLTVVYALDGDRLFGAITLPQLLRHAPVAQLEDVVERDPIAVYPDADHPSVAVQMADYNLSALPVVDENYRLLGVITYDDLIEAIIPEEWKWRGRAERAVEPPGTEAVPPR
jgi:CBS domain-containing protein/sporulation protein YlmC with PRC-barrel domain